MAESWMDDHTLKTPWGFTLEQAFEAMRLKAIVMNDPHPSNKHNPDRDEESATNLFGIAFSCRYPSCRNDRGIDRLCKYHAIRLIEYRTLLNAKEQQEKDAIALRKGPRNRYTGPPRAGYVYRLYGADKVLLYVGKTYSVSERLYGKLGHDKTKQWFSEVVKVRVTQYRTESDAFEAEGFAIRREKPKYNVLVPKQIKSRSPRKVSEYWELV